MMQNLKTLGKRRAPTFGPVSALTLHSNIFAWHVWWNVTKNSINEICRGTHILTGSNLNIDAGRMKEIQIFNSISIPSSIVIHDPSWSCQHHATSPGHRPSATVAGAIGFDKSDDGSSSSRTDAVKHFGSNFTPEDGGWISMNPNEISRDP